MTFLTRNFDPLTALAPKFPNFAIQILLFRLKHTVTVVTNAQKCATKFLHHLSTGCCLPKTTFRTKIGGGWARGASKKCGTPNVFLQSLKLATSNLVHKLGLGPAYQKTTFRIKIGGGLGQGSIPKNVEPLLISAIVEASNFKFGTQIGVGTNLPKTTLRTKIGGGLGQGNIRKNLGPPIYF